MYIINVRRTTIFYLWTCSLHTGNICYYYSSSYYYYYNYKIAVIIAYHIYKPIWYIIAYAVVIKKNKVQNDRKIKKDIVLNTTGCLI